MFRNISQTKLAPRSTNYKASLKENPASESFRGDLSQSSPPTPDSKERNEKSKSKTRKKNSDVLDLPHLNEKILKLEKFSSGSPNSLAISNSTPSIFSPINTDFENTTQYDTNIKKELEEYFDQEENSQSDREFNEHDETRKKVTAHFSEKVNELVSKIDEIKTGLDISVNDLSLSASHMHTEINQNLKSCTNMFLDDVVQQIKHLAKSEIPEIYLRNLPKFGIGGDEENVELHKALITLKSSAHNVTFPSASIEKIKHEMLMIFEKKFEEFTKELEYMGRRLSKHYESIASGSEQLEELLLDMKSEMLILLERVEKNEQQIFELQEEMESQEIHMKEKEVMMDILRDQVNRRNELLEEQRTSFHKELLSLKMALMEKISAKNTEGFFFGGSNQFEIGSRIKQSQKAMEEKLERHVAELKRSFLREKRNLMYEKNIAIEEKEMTINELKRRCKRLEEKLNSLTGNNKTVQEVSSSEKVKMKKPDATLPII